MIRGELVIMERYVDSPLAHLGALGGLDQSELEGLADWATGRLRPDVTVLLDRDPATLQCVEYYFRAPADLAERTIIVIDPMLATGNTAIAAVDRLKETGVTQIRMACLLASPEGISKFQGHHPGIPIWTAAVDERLNDHGYILPGLGDAGDRAYGTR